MVQGVCILLGKPAQVMPMYEATPSTHFSCDLSNRRWVEASRKLVIARPSAVVTARGSVPTIPVTVMMSDK